MAEKVPHTRIIIRRPEQWSRKNSICTVSQGYIDLATLYGTFPFFSYISASIDLSSGCNCALQTIATYHRIGSWAPVEHLSFPQHRYFLFFILYKSPPRYLASVSGNPISSITRKNNLKNCSLCCSRISSISLSFLFLTPHCAARASQQTC